MTEYSVDEVRTVIRRCERDWGGIDETVVEDAENQSLRVMNAYASLLERIKADEGAVSFGGLDEWMPSGRPPARAAQVGGSKLDHASARAVALLCRALVSDDAFAITHQSMGLYRTGLIANLDKFIAECRPTAEPVAQGEAIPVELFAWLTERDLVPDLDEDGSFDMGALIEALNEHENQLLAAQPAERVVEGE